MAITYSFIDNETYGTDDINAITASLTGAGVAPFTSKSSYTAADLNGLTSAITGGGANLGGCLCTKSGTTVTVSEGIIFFENGARLTVDSDGYTVTVPESTAGVIYACFNNSTQTADILFAQTLPTSGYIVKLAAVSATGVLTDCRTYARSKVATFGANVTEMADIEFYTANTATLVEDKTYLAGTVKNNLSQFNYASAIFAYNPNEIKAHILFDLRADSSSSSGSVLFTQSYDFSAILRIIDGKLRILIQTSKPQYYVRSASAVSIRLV